jgi:hypothetical protein
MLEKNPDRCQFALLAPDAAVTTNLLASVGKPLAL